MQDQQTGVGVSCLCPNLVQTKIFESERNRDDAPEPTAAQTAIIGPLREAIAAMGITTDQVAGDIVDAIRENRFWILTHEITRRALGARFRDLQAAEGKTYCYDLHATVLHLLGINHKRLTFRQNGIDRRLTDVHGHVVKDILA